MVELPWRALVPLLVECLYEGFVVRENYKVSDLHQMAEMSHGLVDRQQPPIIGAVLLLCRT